jgi:hypothetical protein
MRFHRLDGRSALASSHPVCASGLVFLSSTAGSG